MKLANISKKYIFVTFQYCLLWNVINKWTDDNQFVKLLNWDRMLLYIWSILHWHGHGLWCEFDLQHNWKFEYVSIKAWIIIVLDHHPQRNVKLRQLSQSHACTIVQWSSPYLARKRRWWVFYKINNLNSKNMCRDIFLCFSSFK